MEVIPAVGIIPLRWKHKRWPTMMALLKAYRKSTLTEGAASWNLSSKAGYCIPIEELDK